MIVQTTTQMAHGLGLRLVAEGVEDAATATEITAMGVDVFQGYHISRPMPAADVAPWVRRWTDQRVGNIPAPRAAADATVRPVGDDPRPDGDRLGWPPHESDRELNPPRGDGETRSPLRGGGAKHWASPRSEETSQRG